MMQQEKHKRQFGANDHLQELIPAVSLTDLLVNEEGVGGAWSFVRSLGHTAPCFMVSLTSRNIDDLFEAEAQIAQSAPVLASGGGGVFQYCEAHPTDGVLLHWAGLIHLHNKRFGQAAIFLNEAIRNGQDHWRVFWNLAVAVQALGDTDLAVTHLRHVAAKAPFFQEAKTMLAQLIKIQEKAEPADDKPEILFQRLELYLTGDDWSTMSEMAQRLMPLAASNDQWDVLYRTALSLHKAGKRDAAKKLYSDITSRQKASSNC